VTDKRLSICLVVPAHDFLTGSGPGQHVRRLAGSRGRQADVTVACGSVPSLSALGRFVEQRLPEFDVVLEGSWPLSGRVSSWCASHGIPAVPVISQVPALSDPWLAWMPAPRTWLARERSSNYLRRAPLVVAETADLQDAIVDRWKVPSGRVEVIDPGVDRDVFHPRDQADARARLGLPQDQRILLYVGPLDRGHDLTPLVEAVDRVGDPAMRLHIIGDGQARAELERRAMRGGAVTFHGWVPEVPTFIAAADLCLALDDSRPASYCLGGNSTQAVREYLASGRPVALASSAPREGLIRHRVSGFLLEHHLLAWIRFLQRECPSRNTLRIMGEAATATPIQGVEAAAEAYLSLCLRVRGTAPRPSRVSSALAQLI
jgi:glycosyltransferase involved in cell wall biosynthesis